MQRLEAAYNASGIPWDQVLVNDTLETVVSTIRLSKVLLWAHIHVLHAHIFSILKINIQLLLLSSEIWRGTQRLIILIGLVWKMYNTIQPVHSIIQLWLLILLPNVSCIISLICAISLNSLLELILTATQKLKPRRQMVTEMFYITDSWCLSCLSK